MNKNKVIYSCLGLFVLFIAVKFFGFAFNDANDKNYQNAFNQGYKIFALNIPKNLNFAGEPVPINNFDVRESLDRELIVNTYYQSQTLLVHKRAKRWFPLIEAILKKNNIPDDFKYIAVIESNLANVVSSAGAVGYWQIIESTAKLHGLEVSAEVDERYNVEKSTEAACKYFKDAYKNLKSWTLVAASYNMGIGGVRNQVDNQKVASYYDLLLNQETARYVFRLLAMKEILSRPQVYGYNLRKRDLYPQIPATKLEFDSVITDMTEFALNRGINYKILKIFNPWLRKTFLTNKERKKYYIEIPNKDAITNYESLLIQMEQNSDPTELKKDSI